MALDHDANSEQIVRVANPGEQNVATVLLRLQQSQPPSFTDVAHSQTINSSSYTGEVPNGSTNLLVGEAPNMQLGSRDMSNGIAMSADLSLTEPTSGSRSLTRNRSDDMDMARNLDYCDTQFEFQNPHWLVGDDFDMEALNHSIMSTPVGFRTPVSSNCANVDRGFGGNTVAEPRSCAFDIHQIEEVHKRWYTYIDQERTAGTGQITPDGVAERTQVDEAYRVNLSQKLQPHLSDDPLPSIELLVKQVCSR